MTEYFTELLNISIPYVSSFPVFVYPMWKERNVRTKNIVIFFCLFTLYMCAVLLISKRIWTIDFGSAQLLKLYITIPANIMPFVVFRRRVWQNIFLQAVAAMYTSITNGVGMYAGENWFKGSGSPMVISNMISLLTIIVTFPPLLFFLRRLCENPAMRSAPIWRYIWILPVTYFCMFLLSGDFFNREAFMGAGPIFIRILIYAALILTCHLLESSLRQVSENVTLKERANMIESQLKLQREQYTRLMENADSVKATRHDMRHHLAVLSGYNQAGESEKLGAYLSEIVGAMPSDDMMYCDNFAVNAVAAHYLGQAQSEGVRVEARLAIPEDTGRVPAMDLCVIVGNLLENAVEACRRVMPGDRYIRVDSRADVHGVNLSIVVENSFDGEWREDKGIYISRKENSDSVREGVGLSSVNAICKKHGGLMTVSVDGSVWKVSALVEMG